MCGAWACNVTALHNEMQHDLDCTVARVDIPFISESDISESEIGIFMVSSQTGNYNVGTCACFLPRTHDQACCCCIESKATQYRQAVTPQPSS